MPDPLWIERRFSSLVGALFPSLVTTNDWGRFIAVVDAANELIFELAKRLQVEEAFLLLKTIGEYRRAVLVDAEGETDISGDRKMFRLALAGAGGSRHSPLSGSGLARPFEFSNLENLTDSFDTAVESSQTPTRPAHRETS